MEARDVLSAQMQAGLDLASYGAMLPARRCERFVQTETLHDLGQQIHATRILAAASPDVEVAPERPAKRRPASRATAHSRDREQTYEDLAAFSADQRTSPPARHGRGYAGATAIAFGVMTAVCGGVLYGWGLVEQRGSLTTIGLPLFLLGQGALLVGLLFKLASASRHADDTAERLLSASARQREEIANARNAEDEFEEDRFGQDGTLGLGLPLGMPVRLSELEQHLASLAARRSA